MDAFEYLNQGIDYLSGAVTSAAGVKSNVQQLQAQVNALNPPAPASPMAALYNDVTADPKNQTLLMLAAVLLAGLVLKKLLKK